MRARGRRAVMIRCRARGCLLCIRDVSWPLRSIMIRRGVLLISPHEIFSPARERERGRKSLQCTPRCLIDGREDENRVRRVRGGEGHMRSARTYSHYSRSFAKHGGHAPRRLSPLAHYLSESFRDAKASLSRASLTVLLLLLPPTI